MQKSSEQIEKYALRVSAMGYLFMALLGGIFFYLASSEAILLDGVYSFVSLLMTFIAQRVSRLVQTPYTDKFHFGFAHFEPMLNVMRILIILSISAFAATSALDVLLKEGRPLKADIAVIYGVLSALGCLFMAWHQNRAARKAVSPILAVDSKNWLIDGILSTGVALTFIGAYFLRGSSYEQWTPFVDPVLVLLLVIMMTPVLLKTLRDNFNQVLLSAPDVATQEKIRERVETILKSKEVDDITIRMLPVGRFLYLQIHVLLLPGTKVHLIDECDAVRSELNDALADIHERLSLDVIFTADKRWTGMEEVNLR